MVQLQINVAESLVQSMGQASLEQQVEAFLQRLMLRKAAEDILKDLKEQEGLLNDPKWEIARELAWDTSKDNYLPLRAMKQ